MTQPHLEGLIPLYHAVNRLMLSLGVVGEVSSLDPAAIGVMDALRAIDGGRYDEALAALPDDLEECHRHSCKRKAALAALPGGGVGNGVTFERVTLFGRDDRYIGTPSGNGVTVRDDGTLPERILFEIATIALSPTPNPHEADRNGND